MIKNLFRAMLFMATVTAFTACSDKDDLEDPSARLAEFQTNTLNVLKRAPNGWVMSIYGDLDFGGFNVLCKFEDKGKVTIANEKFAADTTAVTHYKMEQSGGLMLSFDEYCELFHYFSDPINPDGYSSQTENGFAADLEFRVISASANAVVMRGKKHNAKVVLTPMEAGVAWKDYLTDVVAVSKTIQKGSYHMISGTESLNMKSNKRNRVFTYYTTDAAGIRTTHTLPYIVTPKGITLYEPFSFDGHQVTGFNYDAASEEMSQQGGGSVILKKYVPALSEQFIDGTWFIKKADMGNITKVSWEKFEAAMKETLKFDVRWVMVGTYRTRFGLSCVCGSRSEGFYLGEAYFDYQVLSDTEVKLVFADELDDIGNGELYYNYGKFEEAISTLNNRTFRITTDNVKDPTWIKLTDKNRSTNFFTLYADDTLYVPDAETSTDNQ
jgi:predicted small lipoprotein YifL